MKTSKDKDECMQQSRDTIVTHAKMQTDLVSLRYYTKKELCAILSKKCGTIGGFKNESNSCYLDSTLLALFHFPNNQFLSVLTDAPLILIDDKKGSQLGTQLINALVQMYDVVSSGNVLYCTDLRQLIYQYDKYYRKEHTIEKLKWKTEQLEPADVLMFFERLVDLPRHVQTQTEVYATNKKSKIVKREDKILVRSSKSTTSSSILIDAADLFGKTTVSLKSYIPKYYIDQTFDEDAPWKPSEIKKKSFLRRIEKITYLSAPYLFVHISRLMDDTKLKTFVNAPTKIKLKNNKKNLYLQSIIVHHGNGSGGHYTCFIKCKNQWYHYDDLSFKGKLVKIGDFDALIKWKDMYIFKNCTDLIYA